MIKDTICAPATSSAGGAISVVRISGENAFGLCDGLVHFVSGKKASDSPGGRVMFGMIDGLDEVLVSIFRAPHSYTGEDSVEISCHASPYIVSEILNRLCAAGARLALPGEFTRRAFVNGKMDLCQAEAVADLIASESKAEHDVALNQLKGAYSGKLKELRDSLRDLCALLELELDFSEEDVEFADRGKLSSLCSQTLNKSQEMLDTFRAGNALRSGIPVAITGEPNCGKSTLLNALLGEDRAIVSDIPGTTRDTVEECLRIGGFKLRFIDTAGLRETSDVVEKLGIERTVQAVEKAQIVLEVHDGVSGSADTKFPDAIQIWNKTDLENCRPTPKGFIPISARSGKGINDLNASIIARCKTLTGSFDSESAILVTNERHAKALADVCDSLRTVLTGLSTSLPTVLIAEDLRSAIRSLSSITGDISTDEVLGEIFGKFCIGK